MSTNCDNEIKQWTLNEWNKGFKKRQSLKISENNEQYS